MHRQSTVRLLVGVPFAIALVAFAFFWARSLSGVAQPTLPKPAVAVAAPAATPKPIVAPPTPAPPSRSPEELLAIIQYGAGVGPNDPRVQPFAQQLDRLEAKCLEDRGKLADLVAGANKVLADRGVREPLIDTVRGVATASEGLPAEGPCRDLFTGYAMLRLSGARATSGR